MSRAPQIRAVYSELRRLLGSAVGAAETLDFAARIVRFTLKREVEKSNYDAHINSVSHGPFETWSVDEAMSDGGWRILEYEMDQHRSNIEIGRVRAYVGSDRLFAAEAEIVGLESDRLLRTLAWLSPGRPIDHAGWAIDEEDY